MKPTERQDGPGVDDEDGRNALELSNDENADLCSGCVKCCTYITIEIDAPRAAWEYDQWIWSLHHKNIQLYMEKPERWFIHVDAVCEQLNDQGRCSIYGRHPVLCRNYDPRSCERRLPLADIVAWFQNAYQFEAWIQEKRPSHWARLMKYRADKPDAPPMAPGERRAAPPLVPVTGLDGRPLVGLLATRGAPENGRPARAASTAAPREASLTRNGLSRTNEKRRVR